MSRCSLQWGVDLISLLNQGLWIPVVQTLLLARVWAWMWPEKHGVFRVSNGLAFFIGFVGVDYLYYWNHRVLHHRRLCAWHGLHHSAKQMDFFMTSRNSLLTPFLIVYVWANSLAIYLFANASWFLVAASVGCALDLWRHSEFRLSKSSFLHRALSPWLTMPEDHSWHHSAHAFGCNFAANFILWDRLHGTFLRPDADPKEWGSDEVVLSWRNFLFPKAERLNDLEG